LAERILLILLLILCGAGLLISWMPDQLGWQIFEMSVYGLAILWLLAWALGAIRSASWTWLLLPIPGVVALGAAQLALHGTVYNFSTELDLLRWGTYAAIFLLAFQTSGGERTQKLFLTLFAGYATLLTAQAIFQRFSYLNSPAKIFWYFTPAESASGLGPFLNHDHFASFMALVLPVVAIAMRRRGASQWGMSIAIAGFYAAVVASGSRAGFAVVTIEIVILLALLGSLRNLLVPVMGMIALFAAVVGWGRLYERFLIPGSYAGRLEIARVSLRIIKSSPWFGTGLGTWTLMYPAFAERDIGLTANAAHSDWLQWTSEGGIPLLLIMLALCYGSIRIVRRVPWTLGIPMVFLHCIIEFPMQGRFFPAMLFLIFGVAARAYQETLAPVPPAKGLSRRSRSAAPAETLA
jgi:O-antigen ligase